MCSSVSYIMLPKVPGKVIRYPKYRTYVTGTKTEKKSSWFGFLTGRWSLPASVGVTLLGILQWRHLRKYPYPVEGDAVKGPVADLMVCIILINLMTACKIIEEEKQIMFAVYLY